MVIKNWNKPYGYDTENPPKDGRGFGRRTADKFKNSKQMTGMPDMYPAPTDGPLNRRVDGEYPTSPRT